MMTPMSGNGGFWQATRPRNILMPKVKEYKRQIRRLRYVVVDGGKIS